MMGPDFGSEACFICSEIPAKFHKISDSDGDSNPNILYIICQHFWFKEDDLRSAIVCETCWEKVDQFHQFYLDVKKLHEHRQVAPLSMFIKQEEITIEEPRLQDNCTDKSAENQKLCDITDSKCDIREEGDELPKKEEPADVFPLPTTEERQAKEDFIKQHTCYICDGCNIEFKNFRAIKNHRIEAHNKNTVLCCGNQYRTRGELYQHVQSFLNPEAFKCEICGNTFKSKYKYVRHKEQNHAAEKDLVFKCNRCPKSFIKEGLLKIHLAEHETLENEKAKCEFCGKCFLSKSRLHKHVKVAHKEPMDFICEVCSKGFYQRALFLEHHKTHELTAEQLKELCPVCNKWFSNHTNLLQHVRRHKRGDCKCVECGHVSFNMKSLKMYMKSWNAPDIKRHVCEQSGKECSRAIYMKEHVTNAHTREQLYQCQHCEKKFFSRATLYSHKKKDHPQDSKNRMSKFARRKAVTDGGEAFSGS